MAGSPKKLRVTAIALFWSVILLLVVFYSSSKAITNCIIPTHSNRTTRPEGVKPYTLEDLSDDKEDTVLLAPTQHSNRVSDANDDNRVIIRPDAPIHKSAFVNQHAIVQVHVFIESIESTNPSRFIDFTEDTFSDTRWQISIRDLPNQIESCAELPVNLHRNISPRWSVANETYSIGSSVSSFVVPLPSECQGNVRTLIVALIESSSSLNRSTISTRRLAHVPGASSRSETTGKSIPIVQIELNGRWTYKRNQSKSPKMPLWIEVLAYVTLSSVASYIGSCIRCVNPTSFANRNTSVEMGGKASLDVVRPYADETINQYHQTPTNTIHDDTVNDVSINQETDLEMDASNWEVEYPTLSHAHWSDSDDTSCPSTIERPPRMVRHDVDPFQIHFVPFHLHLPSSEHYSLPARRDTTVSDEIEPTTHSSGVTLSPYPNFQVNEVLRVASTIDDTKKISTSPPTQADHYPQLSPPRSITTFENLVSTMERSESIESSNASKSTHHPSTHVIRQGLLHGNDLSLWQQSREDETSGAMDISIRARGDEPAQAAETLEGEYRPCTIFASEDLTFESSDLGLERCIPLAVDNSNVLSTIVCLDTAVREPTTTQDSKLPPRTSFFSAGVSVPDCRLNPLNMALVANIRSQKSQRLGSTLENKCEGAWLRRLRDRTEDTTCQKVHQLDARSAASTYCSTLPSDSDCQSSGLRLEPRCNIINSCSTKNEENVSAWEKGGNQLDFIGSDSSSGIDDLEPEQMRLSSARRIMTFGSGCTLETANVRQRPTPTMGNRPSTHTLTQSILSNRRGRKAVVAQEFQTAGGQRAAIIPDITPSWSRLAVATQIRAPVWTFSANECTEVRDKYYKRKREINDTKKENKRATICPTKQDTNVLSSHGQSGRTKAKRKKRETYGRTFHSSDGKSVIPRVVEFSTRQNKLL